MVSKEELSETQNTGRFRKFVRSVGALLGRRPELSQEEEAAYKQVLKHGALKKIETISQKAEGMNKACLAILRECAEIPNQASTLPSQGHGWIEPTGESFHQWVFSLSFGRVPKGRIGEQQTPLLIENNRKPRFVLEGITTELDTANFTIMAPYDRDEGYGAPFAEIAFNASTRESDGREFEDGTLNGTADSTGSVRVVLDGHGQVKETWVSRHNQTGMSKEKPRAELIGGLPTTLAEILDAVRLTARAYKDLKRDIENPDRA